MVKEKLNILGLMSGTSLDGLDLAHCSFRRQGISWKYLINEAETISYPPEIKTSLENAVTISSRDLVLLDHNYGRWLGSKSLEFIQKHNLETHYIASHGHTVYHQPENQFTLQIGNGHDIFGVTGIPVIYDFRSLDVALGGQGAPLVPAGDEYLFRDYDCCLNLGGVSNLSCRVGDKRIAFDIAPVNIILNALAGNEGSAYDKDGLTGRSGSIIPELVRKLDDIKYYKLKPPKSLGKEWLLKEFCPVLDMNYPINDVMRSVYEHISGQIADVLNHLEIKNVMVTGGGAHNSFLMELLREKSVPVLILPDKILIDFKEAMVFAFLGYLRIHRIPNVFSSVTGCTRDHCSGIITGAL